MFAKLQSRTFKRRYPKWMVGKPLLYASSALASLGDAMFGYSQGVIAAAQVQPSFIHRMYGPDLTLAQIQSGHTGVNPFLQAIVVSCLSITAFIASFFSAHICDILGRRLAIRAGALIYFLAALIQIGMPNLAALFVGRCIQGVGLGILSMTVPILQCEIAPGHSRGLFVSIEYFFLNSGEISWRGPYIVQACLAAVLFVWTFYMPETPRWLVQHGYKDEGLQVLADLHGNGDISDPMIIKEFVDMETAISIENKLGQGLFAQTNGVNAILYFLPENLARAGFSISEALLYSGACAMIYCAGTIPTMFWIDSVGRRKFLFTMRTACRMGKGRLPTADGLFAAVCIYIFVYGASWGPVPWLLSAEIFPVRARAKGMAVAAATNWFFNFILAFIAPPLFAAIHGAFYFILLASCLASAGFVYVACPETAGKTLEELGEVFGDQEAVDEKVDGYRVVGTEVVLEPELVGAAEMLPVRVGARSMATRKSSKSDLGKDERDF
ncbi:general substrate transporter [Ephemerocybe angulata]|uniref:General substrate transporter n=1 Tax=Ephemerocybe angulata TaxID=980116 RepID=A0A8H6I5X3_9AGAR|nr:general substrate transporter [Tulosesus angulatus]